MRIESIGAARIPSDQRCVKTYNMTIQTVGLESACLISVVHGSQFFVCRRSALQLRSVMMRPDNNTLVVHIIGAAALDSRRCCFVQALLAL